MLKSPFGHCVPSGGKKVPDRPEWIHEIKHDGYRLIVQRDRQRVRLWTRNGHDWSDRFPLIVEALRNRETSFVIDGEAVLLGVDGRSDFDGLLQASRERLPRRPVRSLDQGEEPAASGVCPRLTG
jgi:bifunctional non-homologous end joining protein LigD